MKKHYWSNYIEHFINFDYKISFDASLNNIERVILEFDHSFLLYGHNYKLFVYDELSTIDYYLKERSRNLNEKDSKVLGLLQLHLFENTGFQNLFIYLPNEIGEIVATPFKHDHLHFYISGIESNPLGINEIYFSLISSSTIWNAEIVYGYDDSNLPHNFEPPVNNRFYAYRITPRMNSFIRDLKQKTLELGGTFTLDEEHHKDSTEDGILLDGRIVYQEDIDNGSVKLPE